MTNPINIHNHGGRVNLKPGKYRIDVLGGWGVKLGNFSIALRHNETQQIINAKRAFWPGQSFAFNKRAKKIFVINIPSAGVYVVEFKNPESIKVNRSNLFISSLFEEPIPNENLEIYIS